MVTIPIGFDPPKADNPDVENWPPEFVYIVPNPKAWCTSIHIPDGRLLQKVHALTLEISADSALWRAKLSLIDDRTIWLPVQIVEAEDVPEFVLDTGLVDS